MARVAGARGQPRRLVLLKGHPIPLARLLALRLQAYGEYMAALGWFDSCYAFRLPPSRRKVYYGLQAEHNTPNDCQPSGFWARPQRS